MVARRRRSTRPSACSSPRPHEYIFFVDRSLGKIEFPRRLREAGLDVRVHDKVFSPDAADVEWIRETGVRGWVAFAADEAIVRRDIEFRAVVDSGARILVPGLRKRPSRERADLIVLALPAVFRFLSRNPPPWVAKVLPGRKATHRPRIGKTRRFK
ncbi:MAG: hypothetical protein O7J95_10715 [Planctomycetota bacterium]|nr:hypothetical protein [Planctomycetota bacterium]